jgi:hypothetical protein
MDLRKELAKEHAQATVFKVVDYVGVNPKRFKELIAVYLKGPFRITQRAAWPLSYCVQRHPHLIKPHLKRVLNYLEMPGIHNAIKRNTIRLLQFIEIPRSYQGLVSAICFGYLQDKKEQIAIRVFSMSVLHSIASQNPELKHELKLIIEDNLPYASPAFIARAKKVMKDL